MSSICMQEIVEELLSIGEIKEIESGVKYLKLLENENN